MNINYLKALDKIRAVHSELDRILTAAPCETLEDSKACRAIECLVEELQGTEWTLEHYNKPVLEGKLHEERNGRFSIADNELTCGHSLEVWNEEYQEWETGRVEHTSGKGYYFYNSDMHHPALYEGMRVRIRIKGE